MSDDVLADMDERLEGGASSSAAAASSAPAGGADRKKGRGRDDMDEDRDGRYAGKAGVFESLGATESAGPQKCEAGRGCRCTLMGAGVCAHEGAPLWR